MSSLYINNAAVITMSTFDAIEMLPNNDLKAEAYKLTVLSALSDTKIESEHIMINIILRIDRENQINMNLSNNNYSDFKVTT